MFHGGSEGGGEEGDIDGLGEVLDVEVFETPWHRITLGDIIDYLQGSYVDGVLRLIVEEYTAPVSGKVLGE